MKKKTNKLIAHIVTAACIVTCMLVPAHPVYGAGAEEDAQNIQSDKIASEIADQFADPSNDPFDYTRRLENMKAAMTDNAEKVDVEMLYASVGVYEGDVRTDYIIPLDGRSEETFKAAFPNYDDYNGTAYIFRSGLGRKTKFVPGMTDFLGAHPQE